ncbi:MAG: hypothetical protein GEV08_14415 [Acidimicrobiia bacterium]|nr:hypothetical protein [Acidimicrobiia bacterium]
MTQGRDRLVQLTSGFMDAFNRNDLDGVMACFAPDAVYDEFTGRANEGLAAIRAAFEPQFTGAFGDMKFLEEDQFVDESTGKVMASWLCTLEARGEPVAWRGLDLIHWRDGRVVHKATYAKAKVPLLIRPEPV